MKEQSDKDGEGWSAGVTMDMADSVRGILQILRGKTGATFKDLRVHCSQRGDDLSYWPLWTADAEGYVTEQCAATLIYQIMMRHACTPSHVGQTDEQGRPMTYWGGASALSTTPRSSFYCATEQGDGENAGVPCSFQCAGCEYSELKRRLAELETIPALKPDSAASATACSDDTVPRSRYNVACEQYTTARKEIEKKQAMLKRVGELLEKCTTTVEVIKSLSDDALHRADGGKQT